MAEAIELRAGALACLVDTDPAAKALAVARLATAAASGALAIDCDADLGAAMAGPLLGAIPGRPVRPELVAPRLVGRRSMVTVEGRAMLIHALAHIEFNAMNLALDAIARFAGLPPAYYRDWLQVAAQEAAHFTLLTGHLASLGQVYGDFPAHDSLWEMVAKTSGDVMARMALVPRTLEARGLDAIPPLRAKLAQAGDQAAAAILDIILRDEEGHVAIGNHWYGLLCGQRGLEPVATYRQLAQTYAAPVLRGPFNLAARRRAGFSEEELAQMQAGADASHMHEEHSDDHRGSGHAR
jgi:uncharacterized ferritin-like protein (DUF455 family)